MENDPWIQTTRQRIATINARIDELLSTLQWDRNDLKRWNAEQRQKSTYSHNEARHDILVDKLETSSKESFSKRQSKKTLPSSARFFYTHAPLVLSFSDQQPVQGGAHVHPMIPATNYASLAKAIRAQQGLPAPRVYAGQGKTDKQMSWSQQ
ncbi:hypothetical protein BJV82DRAFT_610341 [Fennellomyces sp. T-0311]|nr:hypothetical protein BJV82DRAFT_610341 [Fennellomyces sp. T-0311]